ncbi:heterokaryon incompatibility protein-domain-containing protein [Bipolaris maydis]|uniref:heterokaryon incompatibility protein-domain-containing protein n=1 Tax=Cochliobolus heterostrophus TaxID=5016 RepID=UPI0024D60820|nr:heterokaryon incompatibility protein-domain-containing protein [Bipolaris maydis]KAJ6202137.1 heterokaryon incompatibility protein-domain-containing protein [Bipolaris maydis]KAJ6273265.1 heterokaryon incompatibility protein-domain-containing protein [Bipolaris maydis]KAJ6284475.1 heterokaryon incompatibility protein-domain-containing protein [Bipolaris maydis]
MDPLPNHVYEGLPTREAIRILISYPAIDFQAPLEAHFEYNNEELSGDTTISSQGFDAVSYCWGDPKSTHIIYFKNFTHGHLPSLTITAKVDSMLRHLRKPHKQRRLWIDAICINQADAEEKTLQVPLMRRIYTAALKVHVWLGAGETFDAQAAFMYLKRIVVADEVEKETVFLPNQFRKDCAATRSTLQQLFLNPWFTRRWVLQEIALAHEITVHYGHDKIAWNWFAKGTLLLPELDEQHKTQGRWASYQPYIVAKKTIETSLKRELWLPDSLLEHVSAECSDPRDRLFALYGILGHNYSGSEMAVGMYDQRNSSVPLQILPEVD